MSEIALHATGTSNITCVPNSFIDNYMVEANGEYVKIYLYLLRCTGNSDCALNIPDMADVLDHTQKDIKKALYYWANQGLLKLTHDNSGEINGIFLQDAEPSVSIISETPTIAVPIAAPISPVVTPLPDIVSIDKIQNASVDEQIRSTIYMAERLLNRTISPADTEAIIYWHDGLFLDWELIQHLIEYCAEKKISSLSYMNKVAINYASEGITSIEDAKSSEQSHQELTIVIKNSFGISRRDLTEIEYGFAKKWTYEYGFSVEMIREACERTIMNIQTPSFKYADKILNNWYENNVKTLADVENFDNKYKNESAAIAIVPEKKGGKRFSNYPQRNNDFTNIEKKLINT